MTTQVMATVVDGELKLDAPLELPNASRVKIVVEVEMSAEQRQEKFRRGVTELLDYIEQHPIHLGGIRFTRDQLYERD